MTENVTYCDKHVSSRKCIFFVVMWAFTTSSVSVYRACTPFWVENLTGYICDEQYITTKKTLPWWYVFVTVGHVFYHACTPMTILWQNQGSHTCAVVEVFHDITKIIITEVSTSMTINGASWKCFRQWWPTCGIHHNGSPSSYRVPVWIR